MLKDLRYFLLVPSSSVVESREHACRKKAERIPVTSHPVTSHPPYRVDAQDVKTLSHDGGCGLTEQHPPHVDFHHLTWRKTNI